jgi:hypothetical protein
MARYFFNIYDGGSSIDPIGSEHPDLASVREEAVETVAERLRGRLLIGNDVTGWLMNVKDEAGATVLILSLSAMVQYVSPESHDPLQ